MATKKEPFQVVTTGFVVQTFEFCEKLNKHVCSEQQFVASDTVDHEDLEGNKLEEVPDYEYQPFNMTL